MKRLFYFPAILLAIVTAGCGGAADSTIETADVKAATAPAADEDKPNADYKPAFEGQHRIAAVTTSTAISVDKLDTGIGHPWAIIPIPGERLLVTDKSGYMTIRDGATGKELKKITGFPKVNDKGQGGLLDVALDPDFEKKQNLVLGFFREQGYW